MAEHRQDGGLHRSEFVLGPAARMSPAECPAERTQRSSGRGPREWSRESGAVETRSGGSGHRGPRSRDAGFVGRERLVVRTGCPRIPPAGTFSPHGVEKDPIQASARPLNGSFPITPQRQQPRVPPLPRIDSRQTEPPRPRERAGVRAKGPLSSFRLCCSPDLLLHSLCLHSLGLRPPPNNACTPKGMPVNAVQPDQRGRHSPTGPGTSVCVCVREVTRGKNP